MTILTYPGTLLTAVTEPGGRALTLTHNSPVSLIFISQIADPLGRTLQFGYNITGELTVVTDTTGTATSYSYDANHRLTAITDANHHTFVTNVYNSDGRVSQQYDAQNNLTTFNYDIVNHVTTVTTYGMPVSTHTTGSSAAATCVRFTAFKAVLVEEVAALGMARLAVASRRAL